MSKLTVKEEAKNILDQVIDEGMSTDNCFSSDFKEKCRSMAISRAKNIATNNYEDVASEILKL